MKFSENKSVLSLPYMENGVPVIKHCEGYLSQDGIWAVRVPPNYPDIWVVTHIPSGATMIYPFLNKEFAAKYVEKISEIDEWSDVKEIEWFEDSGRIKPMSLRIRLRDKCFDAYKELFGEPA